MPAVTTTRPELLGTHGMVAASHWLAAQSGMAVLEAGGNAFDAAAAAGLVLHVVEPHLNGLGGDVPVIGCEAAGRPFVLCGQGPAPERATAQAFVSLGLEAVPGTGLLPAVVPGAFGTWCELVARFGTWRPAQVLEAAIGYASDGYPLLPAAAAAIAGMARRFEQWPESARVWLPDGVAPAAGARVRNPALARTLTGLVRAAEAAGPGREAQWEGAYRAFYSGFVAERIDTHVRTAVPDSSGASHSGLLTADDLARWRPRLEVPVTVDVLGATVAKTGPWGQGPVLLQQLLMLEALGVTDAEPSADLLHTAVEVAKLALADRDAWYGDPRFVDVPLETLLSRGYAADRARLVGDDASAELRPGSPDGRTPRLPRLVTDALAAGPAPDGRRTGGAAPGTSAGTGEPTFAPPDGDTCHLDVVDRWGNVVSATPSGGWLQSSPAVAGLGFALSTRGQMFWLEQGLPSSLGPGRRPRTTLSPTLVLRDGRPVLACGTPGGDNQDQWQVPLLLGALARGLDLATAIDEPTWHTTHHVSSFDPRTVDLLGVHVEERVGQDVVAELERRGHRVTVAAPWSLGRVSAAGVRDDGMLRAAATSRGMQAYAVGR